MRICLVDDKVRWMLVAQAQDDLDVNLDNQNERSRFNIG